MHVSAASVEPPISPLKLSILAGLFVIIGPMSMALYTPAMPTIGSAMGADEATMQLSITVYLAGFTICQLICGPLSDRYGRRPIIIGFSIIYILGCGIILYGAGPESLIFGRAVQGIGACAGPALSRAMIRDCYQGDQGARLMGNVAMVLSIGPALAPLIGAMLLDAFHWQAIFVAMGIYGVAMAFVVFAATPETNLRPNLNALDLGSMGSNYVRIGTDPRFIRLAMAVGCTLGGIFAFSVMLPFVLIDRIGLQPMEFGIGIGLSAVAFFVGSALANGLMGRMGASGVVILGLVLVLVSALMMSAGIAVFGASIATALLPVYLWAIGTALVMPGGTMGALNPFGRIAGSAAALLGFAQMGLGAVASLAAGLIGDAVLAQKTIPIGMAVVAITVYFALADAAGRADRAAASTQPAE